MRGMDVHLSVQGIFVPRTRQDGVSKPPVTKRGGGKRSPGMEKSGNWVAGITGSSTSLSASQAPYSLKNPCCRKKAVQEKVVLEPPHGINGDRV